MILCTNGIEYDDRIRKEMLTVMKLYPDIQFKIFAIISGDATREEKGISDYRVEYEIPLLQSRLKYKQATHVFRKAWDFYRTVKSQLKDFDAIWCADIDVICFVLFAKHRIIWDMHELPTMFLGSSWKKMLLKYMMRRCKVVVHANAERLQYLKEQHAISNSKSQYVIRNLPDFEEEAMQDNGKFEEFTQWLDGAECVYLQGATAYSRCDKESVEAIMRIPRLKGCVVGRFRDHLKHELREMYGDELEQKFLFTGMVPQKLTPRYIKMCKVSLVLYRNTVANNYYCEPNRMFQSIINDCPVVVGCNPPMKELVDKYQFGVSLADDGSDVFNIVDGIQKVLDNHDFYLQKIAGNKDVLQWSQQDGEFEKIINKVFNK